jgi:hypothetical protein
MVIASARGAPMGALRDDEADMDDLRFELYSEVYTNKYVCKMILVVA